MPSPLSGRMTYALDAFRRGDWKAFKFHLREAAKEAAVNAEAASGLPIRRRHLVPPAPEVVAAELLRLAVDLEALAAALPSPAPKETSPNA